MLDLQNFNNLIRHSHTFCDLCKFQHEGRQGLRAIAAGPATNSTWQDFAQGETPLENAMAIPSLDGQCVANHALPAEESSPFVVVDAGGYERLGTQNGCPNATNSKNIQNSWATTASRTIKSVIMSLTATAVLSACATIQEADGNIQRVNSLTKQQQRQMKAAQQGEVIFENKPYYGEAVDVSKGSRNGKPLPRKVEGARSITAKFDKPASITSISKLITEQTGIPVNIRQRYLLPEGGYVEIPIGGSLKTSHTGSLSKFLDIVSARMDAGWNYDGAAITFDRMVTQHYTMPIPSNSTEFNTSVAGVSGTSGGSRSVTLTKSTSQDPWSELEQLLKPITPSPSYVQLSRNSGRVTIFGPPSVHTKARVVIDDFHATYSTRIGLEVAVFFVDVDKSDDFGIGLNAANTNGGNALSILGAGGSLGGNGVLTLSRGNSSINFKALAKNAAVVDYRLGSTIAQSGVVSPIVLTRSTNYVAKTTTTTSDAGNTTAVETATIDTGISIHALPRLIDRKQIQLSLTLLQNDLTTLDSFTSGNSTVQLPVVDQRALQNDSVLTPGETLILSGYEQEVSSRAQSGTGIAKFIGLGGSNTGKVRKIRMIVFVRPSLIANKRG